MRLSALLLLAVSAWGCAQEDASVEGNPKAGQLLLRQYGCGTCHEIPGVAAARGNVGPSLKAVGKRVYLAGRVPNTPANMADWIRYPHRFDPRTAMADMQVTESHAHDMVAYLQRLK